MTRKKRREKTRERGGTTEGHRNGQKVLFSLRLRGGFASSG
jgi:hypothetical protein